MSITTSRVASARALPQRPNIEYLKNEAKRRLAAHRPGQPGLKLSAVQFEIAREYGFTSWRALKTAFEHPSSLRLEAAGDWIGQWAQGPRIALHVGGDVATMDSPDYGAFGFAVHGFEAGAGRMVFSLPRINAGFKGEWVADEALWRGVWRQDGRAFDMEFRRGVYPPAPVVEGLDGIWEGLFDDQLARFVLRITTDRHGTFAMADSPERSGYNLPVETIERRGDELVFTFKIVTIAGALDAGAQTFTAVLTRGDKTFDLTLRRRLPGEAPLELPVADIPPELLPRYAGDFGSSNWRVVVTLGKDGLVAQFPNGDIVDLMPISEREFRFRRGVGRLIFDIKADGQVSGLVFRLRGQDSPARRHG